MAHYPASTFVAYPKEHASQMMWKDKETLHAKKCGRFGHAAAPTARARMQDSGLSHRFSRDRVVPSAASSMPNNATQNERSVLLNLDDYRKMKMRSDHALKHSMLH